MTVQHQQYHPIVQHKGESPPSIFHHGTVSLFRDFIDCRVVAVLVVSGKALFGGVNVAARGNSIQEYSLEIRDHAVINPMLLKLSKGPVVVPVGPNMGSSDPPDQIGNAPVAVE